MHTGHNIADFSRPPSFRFRAADYADPRCRARTQAENSSLRGQPALTSAHLCRRSFASHHPARPFLICQRTRSTLVVRFFRFCTCSSASRPNLVRFFRFCTSNARESATRLHDQKYHFAFSQFRSLSISEPLFHLQRQPPLRPLREAFPLRNAFSNLTAGTETKNLHEGCAFSLTAGTKAKKSHSPPSARPPTYRLSGRIPSRCIYGGGQTQQESVHSQGEQVRNRYQGDRKRTRLKKFRAPRLPRSPF